MEVYQLCTASVATGAGTTFKLPGHRIALGSIPVQVYTTQATAFVGTVKLQGTIATDDEVTLGTNRWTYLRNASWTTETIDALFAQVTHIRSYITAYTSGAISVRLGY